MRYASAATILRCALLLTIPAPSHAVVYQVGKGMRYGSLQAVTARLQPGDVVEVAGGEVYPGGAILSGNGSSDKKIVLRGIRKNGARPVFAAVGRSNSILKVQGTHIVVEGFEFTAGGDPRAFRGFYAVGDDITLRDSLVYDCNCTGISGADASGSLLLDHVEVSHCGSGLMAHQIYVGSDPVAYPGAVFRMQFCYVHDGAGGNNVKSRVTRNEIYYNWIEGAWYHELDLVGPDPKAHPGLPPGTECDSDITGNVFIKTASAQGALARMGSDGTGASNGRYRFVNNTVVLRSGAAAAAGLFWMKRGMQSLGLCNNVFWMAPEAGTRPLVLLRDEAGVKPEAGGNWFSPGDPRFANPQENQFRPLSNSPLKGEGVSPAKALGHADLPWGLWPPVYEPAASIAGPPALRQARQPIDTGAYAAAP